MRAWTTLSAVRRLNQHALRLSQLTKVLQEQEKDRRNDLSEQ